MGLYQEYVLLRLVHLAMRNRELVPYRKRAIASADNRELEIGIGSGLNLPFYPPHVQEIIGLEPAPKLIAMARKAKAKPPISVTLVQGSAEAIPLDDASLDTVVTRGPCVRFPMQSQALREARRVLAPGGQLLFVEHCLSPDKSVRRWQDLLTPAWKRIGGRCRLNRPIRSLIESGGFDVAQIDMGYANGSKPMIFMYEGCARPA